MGKCIIVTGASTGIGAKISEELAKSGYDIAINYIGDIKAAEEVKSKCESFGVKAEIFFADVSDFSQCENMLKEINEKFDNIYGLVNNAGITRDTLLLRMSEKQFDDVINVNLKSVFNMSKLVSAQLIRARKGKIVSMASVVGLSGSAGQTNYAASKAGIIGFTKSLAKEIGSRGICVNCIAPGFVETPMTDVLNEKYKEELLSQIPLKRYGKTEDIANAVKFLISEDADYITGQVICVDGGLAL